MKQSMSMVTAAALKAQINELQIYARGLAKVAAIDTLLARVRAMPDEVAAKPLAIASVKQREYKGPPSYGQWKRYLAMRLTQRIEKGSVTVPCLSCGMAMPYSDGIVKRVAIVRGRKASESKGAIVIGCVVKFDEESDDSIEAIESDMAAGVSPASLLDRLDTLGEPKAKYVPVFHRGCGCLDCQMVYLKMLGETKRTYEAAYRVWQAGKHETASPSERTTFVEVEPRDWL